MKDNLIHFNHFPKTPFFSSDLHRPFLFSFPEIKPSPVGNEIAQLYSTILETVTIHQIDLFSFLDLKNFYNENNEIFQSKRAKTGEKLLDNALDKLSNEQMAILRKYAIEERTSELIAGTKIFETLLDHRLLYSNLQSWNEIIESYLSTISCSAIDNLNINPNKLKIHILYDDFYSILSSIPSVGKIRLFAFLYYLGIIEPKLLQPHKNEIDLLLIKYIKCSRQKKIYQNPTFSSPALDRIMWTALGLCSFCSTSSPFFSRVIVLDTFFQELDQISKAGGYEQAKSQVAELFNFGLAMNETGWIMITLIIFQAIVLSDERAAEFCSEEMIERWKRYSVPFLQFLGNTEDEELITLYAHLATEKVIEIPYN